MNRSKKHAMAVFVLALALASQGFMCSDSQLRKAAVASQKLATFVSAFQDAEIAAYKAGEIDAETHRAIQSELLAIGKSGVALDNAIRNLKNAKSAAAELAAFQQAVADLGASGIAHIKNEKTKTALQAIFLSIQTLATTIAIALA